MHVAPCRRVTVKPRVALVAVVGAVLLGDTLVPVQIAGITLGVLGVLGVLALEFGAAH